MARAGEQAVHGVADVLFVGEAEGGFFGEGDERAEMVRELFEQFDAGEGFELLAAEEGLQRERGFLRRYVLPQARLEMREIAKRIELARGDQIQVGQGAGLAPNDHGVGGVIAEALRVPADETGHAADEIEEGQGVDKSEQVADRDLTELKAQPLFINDTEFEQAFSERLAPPQPLEKNAVSDRDHKIGDGKERQKDVAQDDVENGQQDRQRRSEDHDTREIDDPGEEA